MSQHTDSFVTYFSLCVGAFVGTWLFRGLDFVLSLREHVFSHALPWLFRVSSPGGGRTSVDQPPRIPLSLLGFGPQGYALASWASAPLVLSRLRLSFGRPALAVGLVPFIGRGLLLRGCPYSVSQAPVCRDTSFPLI